MYKEKCDIKQSSSITDRTLVLFFGESFPPFKSTRDIEFRITVSTDLSKSYAVTNPMSLTLTQKSTI